jgi:hypothetical protein
MKGQAGHEEDNIIYIPENTFQFHTRRGCRDPIVFPAYHTAVIVFYGGFLSSFFKWRIFFCYDFE